MFPTHCIHLGFESPPTGGEVGYVMCPSALPSLRYSGWASRKLTTPTGPGSLLTVGVVPLDGMRLHAVSPNSAVASTVASPSLRVRIMRPPRRVKRPFVPRPFCARLRHGKLPRNVPQE